MTDSEKLIKELAVDLEEKYMGPPETNEMADIIIMRQDIFLLIGVVRGLLVAARQPDDD